LPDGKFSHKQATLNEKRFSRRRFSVPWDGGGNGPIALREFSRFSPNTPGNCANKPCKSRAAGVCPDRFPDQHGDALPWKSNIVTTVFWVGEQAGGNNPVPNYKSCWDANWTSNYGGFDTPEPSLCAGNYIPASFTPRQNPFYLRLPYNDVTHGQFKAGSAAW